MPATVVLVHDDPEFVGGAAAALREVGIDIVAFASSMSALEAVEQAAMVRVVVTRDNFVARGDPNGISLVMVARQKRPNVQAIVLCGPEVARFGEGVGVALKDTATPAEIVEAVQRMLAQPEKDAKPA